MKELSRSKIAKVNVWMKIMNDLTSEPPLIIIILGIGAIFVLGYIVVLPFIHALGILKRMKKKSIEEKQDG